MRVFVKYNSEGEVLSVSKVEKMPKGVDHPYASLEPGESVIELPEEGAHAKLDPLELHNNHKMDMKKKKLVKKS